MIGSTLPRDGPQPKQPSRAPGARTNLRWRRTSVQCVSSFRLCKTQRLIVRGCLPDQGLPPSTGRCLSNDHCQKLLFRLPNKWPTNQPTSYYQVRLREDSQLYKIKQYPRLGKLEDDPDSPAPAKPAPALQRDVVPFSLATGTAASAALHAKAALAIVTTAPPRSTGPSLPLAALAAALCPLSSVDKALSLMAATSIVGASTVAGMTSVLTTQWK